MEGPKRILKYLAWENPEVQLKVEWFVHPCQACIRAY